MYQVAVCSLSRKQPAKTRARRRPSTHRGYIPGRGPPVGVPVDPELQTLEEVHADAYFRPSVHESSSLHADSYYLQVSGRSLGIHVAEAVFDML